MKKQLKFGIFALLFGLALVSFKPETTNEVLNDGTEVTTETIGINEEEALYCKKTVTSGGVTTTTSCWLCDCSKL